MGKMTKKEIKLMVAEEALQSAKNEWNEAVEELMQGKGLHEFGNKYDKRETAARIALDKAERNYRAAKEDMTAISDEEADELADAIAGNWKQPDQLPEGEEAFLDALADSF